MRLLQRDVMKRLRHPVSKVTDDDLNGLGDQDKEEGYFCQNECRLVTPQLAGD